MKITKTQLKQIIKEELEIVQESKPTIPGMFDIPDFQGKTGEPRKEQMTELELYAHFAPIVKRLGAFNDDMNHAAGLTTSSFNTLQLSDELHSEISSAILKLEGLRIEMAKAIGQDPHPHMRS